MRQVLRFGFQVPLADVVRLVELAGVEPGDVLLGGDADGGVVLIASDVQDAPEPLVAPVEPHGTAPAAGSTPARRATRRAPVSRVQRERLSCADCTGTFAHRGALTQHRKAMHPEAPAHQEMAPVKPMRPAEPQQKPKLTGMDTPEPDALTRQELMRARGL